MIRKSNDCVSGLLGSGAHATATSTWSAQLLISFRLLKHWIVVYAVYIPRIVIVMHLPTLAALTSSLIHTHSLPIRL
ncbi:uncharacterized protein F5891DRAFT_720811 [Suillus fuscotomentosus]|uniref:Uncharacterized protein n=1 Tax=Suillus fuscotomentosus TaxID=1912939 RepID=A0AAD4EFC8_9AGAM|nr:uncharacterized protein F5891DRAFT_720811 [Suillus fuscotomentosus]KAG1905026.1 hypothetical protein F5891DRAFT_720811 [Suillus fuscotomentosus]